jgi:3-oxoacyl-[acyl-carrier-protein] synthase II
MSSRRVVVTGIGMATPLGVSTEGSWRALIEGRSGITTVGHLKDVPYGLRVTIAGLVPDFDPRAWFDDPKEVQRTDRFIQLATCATHQAWLDSGLPLRLENADARRAGAIMGIGFGGVERLTREYQGLVERGAVKVSAYSIPAVISNIAPGMAAIRYNLRGPNFALASACASGAHAIGEAFVAIREGRCDLCVAGGAEAPVNALTVAAFGAARALSTSYQDQPARASRPFDKNRDGFVVGEGAGMLVLEELGHAQARGARIHAELLGYGATCDAAHVTAPAPDGEGAYVAMADALSMAKMSPDEIDVVLAHGTSTPYNDVIETVVIKRLLGEHACRVAVSAPKSMIGHSLGAAGGIQAVIAVLVLTRRIVPPTINYDEPDPACDLDYVGNAARETAAKGVLVNSFGFGGTNAVLAFGGLRSSGH